MQANLQGKKRELVVLACAIIVGLTTGLLSILFNLAIDLGAKLVVNKIQEMRFIALVLVIPCISAGATWLLYKRGFKSHQYGFGVAQVITELRLMEVQILKLPYALMHMVASLITLVSGLTAGRFGPTVHMGAALGSSVAYRFKLDEDDIRMLIGCGVTSALSIAFGMPLFATVFVLEVLFRENVYRYVAPMLLSGVVAYTLANYVGFSSGVVNFYHLTYPLQFNAMSILMLVGLGLSSGLLATVYIRAVEVFSKRMKNYLPLLARLLFTAMIIGLINYLNPMNMVLHHGTFEKLLEGNITTWILILFIVTQVLGCAMTLGSGYIGGNFFPGLAIGTAFGMLWSKLAEVLKVAVISPSQMGVLGAVAMLAGFLNAPLACVVFCIEATHSSSMIFPALLVCSLSVGVNQSSIRRDIFTQTADRLTIKV